jgi:hypothetical protein
MASVLFKNTGGGQAYKASNLYGPIYELPPDEAQGICPTFTMANVPTGEIGPWTNVPLQASGTNNQLGFHLTGKIVLSRPMAPMFIKSATAVTFNYEIDGFDHFGDPIQSNGTIGAATLGGRTFRIFSVVTAVRVQRTDTTAGSATINVGYESNVASGNGAVMVLPLPVKLDSPSYLMGLQLIDAAGLTLTTAGGYAVNTIVLAAGAPTNTVVPTSALLPAANNVVGWTAAKLAPLGVMAVTRAIYANAAANAVTPRYRPVFIADLVKTT